MDIDNAEAKHLRLDHRKKLSNFKLFETEGIAFCKKHGTHEKWRAYTNNKIKAKAIFCMICHKETSLKNFHQFPLKYLIYNTRQRGWKITITEQDLLEKLKKQNNKCALTGIEFTKTLKPSLDRIDSTKGYILSNIQLTLIDINRMKRNFPEDKFIALCVAVAKYTENKN